MSETSPVQKIIEALCRKFEGANITVGWRDDAPESKGPLIVRRQHGNLFRYMSISEQEDDPLIAISSHVQLGLKMIPGTTKW